MTMLTAARRPLRPLFALLIAFALGLGLLATSASPAQAAYPDCASSASDPDGDGWGWENGQTCRVIPDCASSASDPDGDGWGWENGRSCKVAPIPNCASAASDPDGDGWGWENGRSCKVVSTGGLPPCPSNVELCSTEPYAVSGLGARKQALLAAGGDTLDMAVAMLETERMVTGGPGYPYGDAYPDGTPKTGDAANFGIFKANWGMMRTACTQFQGKSQAQWNDGAVLDSNLAADVACLNQAQAYYGGGKTWFAGHRNGQTGLNNPNTEDINTYWSAVMWLKSVLDQDPSRQTNDMRYWVKVKNI